jgi:hypothetical protein
MLPDFVLGTLLAASLNEEKRHFHSRPDDRNKKE